ncbi:MAG: 2-phosphosulfolactate phosphatase [Ignavibacteriaceae bacterium]
MKINVLFYPLAVDELYFTGKTTIVIDVLRASSVIITALENGAKEIIPVATVEFAVKVSGGMFGGQTLLGGERNTKKIEGFALGNSPLEYTPEIVNGKTIVHYTTNGTRTIARAKFSENLFVASFMNLSSIAAHISELNIDFEIVCAGRGNMFSMEDTVCAGRIISEIIKLKEDAVLTDSARAAVALGKTFGKSILKMFKETEHGKILLDNGFEEDLKYCSKVNSSQAIPYFTGNVIKLLQVKTDPPEEK